MYKLSFDHRDLSPLKLHRFSIGHTAKAGEMSFYLKSFHNGPVSLRHFQSEEAFYRNLGVINHIIPLLGTCDISGQTFFVFPLIEKDLYDYVGKVSGDVLISEILLPLLGCLEKIHEAGYIHGDIKLENVRVDEQSGLRVYLADFGKSLKMGSFSPHRISSLSQHIPPDLTTGFQMDVYSLGVLAFQLLFGIDFIKKFQMAGRDFKLIPESLGMDHRLLQFISIATAPSALDRFKSATHAKAFLVADSSSESLVCEKYDLDRYFEFYVECMRATFIESGRSTADFEEFIGPGGAKYYERLQKWSQKKAHLVHLRSGLDLIGICEASIKNDGTGMISSIFISKEYRGKGGAQALEESAMKFFANEGAELVNLNVVKDNARAISFYRKQQWTESDVQTYPGAIQFIKRI